MRLQNDKSVIAGRPAMSVPCKCCGADTVPFANIDANRSCADVNGRVFPPSARSISYLRCRRCDFIFTPDFDDCSDSEITEQIYNSEYIIADPDFKEVRPKSMSEMMSNEMAALKGGISALDYGGGNGTFARFMVQAGFAFQCADPYFGASVEAARQFDLVTSFEVMEHTIDPKATLETMLSYLRPDGVIWISTNLQPRDVTADWWYIGPRNGHFSIFSEQSLQQLTRRGGAFYLSLDRYNHLIFLDYRSEILKGILDPDRKEVVLYLASRRSLPSFLHTAKQIRHIPGCGGVGVRHLMRAVAWEAAQRAGVVPSEG